MYDYHWPEAGVPLTEEEGGVRKEGWNELLDGTVEAVAASKQRGWGHLMWPVPRWPPPTAAENVYADGWESGIAAKVLEAEEEALAEAAAARPSSDLSGFPSTTKTRSFGKVPPLAPLTPPPPPPPPRPLLPPATPLGPRLSPRESMALWHA